MARKMGLNPLKTEKRTREREKERERVKEIKKSKNEER
jgi:hypothetical protein